MICPNLITSLPSLLAFNKVIIFMTCLLTVGSVHLNNSSFYYDLSVMHIYK